MDDPVGRTPDGARVDDFYRVLVEQAVDPFLVIDTSLEVSFASRGITYVLGYEASELLGFPALELLTAESRELALDAWVHILPSTAQGGRVNNPLRVTAIRKDGTEVSIQVQASTWPDDAAGGLVVQLSLAGSEQLLGEAVHAILEGSDHNRVLDMLGSIIENDVSGAAAALASGWDGSTFTRMSGHSVPLDLRHPHPIDAITIADVLAGPEEVVDLFDVLAPASRTTLTEAGFHALWLAKARTANEPIPSSALFVCHPAPGPPGPVYRGDIRRAVRFAELGLRWELQQRLLAWDASHDHLTRLINRVELQERLDTFVGTRAVLYCDLDDFKPVNDRYGHRYGDAVLVAVARRLEATASPHVVARLGGDEFAIIVEDPAGTDAPVQLAQRLIEAVSLPLDAYGVRTRVGLSVGVAVDLTGTANGDAMLHAADVALHQAKADGKGRVARTVNGEAVRG